jgi:hypothetical protein
MKISTYYYPFLLFIAFSVFCIQESFGQVIACENESFFADQYSVSTPITVKYGENYNRLNQLQELSMDIYEPDGDTSEVRPLIILAFGGSFIFGQRQDMAELCKFFSRKGYVAATIDYRLYPLIIGLPDEADMQDAAVKAVGDMKAAIRYFRQSVDDGNPYRIDPEIIMVGGLSAGSVTALHTAYLDTTDDIPQNILDIIDNNGGLEGSSGDSTNLTYSSDVNGVLNFSGALFDVDVIDNDDPPLASMHGTADDVVPFLSGFAVNIIYMEGSGMIHPKADSVGVDNYLLAVPGGGHTDIYTDTAAYSLYQIEFLFNGVDFLRDIFCDYLSNTSEEAEKTAIQVFPNPAKDRLYIKTNTQESVSLYVADLQGKKITHIPSIIDSEILHLDDYQPGMYLLYFLDRNGKHIKTEKFFVQ